VNPGYPEGLDGSRMRTGILAEETGAPEGAGEAPSWKPAPAGRRPGRVWIAWERQRRSLELAARLGADLRLFLDENRGWLRYPLSAFRTVRLLRACRGKDVFVQNPSMVLAALAGILKRPLGYRLVVDRHSNFGFLSGGNSGLKRRLSDLLSDFTLRRADATVVTNPELAAFVEKRGGRPFVLPDPFPEIPAHALEAPGFPAPRGADAPREILFVSSWAFDEPIEQAIEACRALRGRVIVRITGRPKPAYARLLQGAPDNFVPTGFIPDSQYFALMARCDAVLAVTTRPCTLVCGAYEALALGKPLILGDSDALRDYFDDGAVYTDATVPGLIRSLEAVCADLPALRDGARRLYRKRHAQWQDRLESLEWLLDRRPVAVPGGSGADDPAPAPQQEAAGSQPNAPGPGLDYPVDAAIETPAWRRGN